jgi:hypothetical protein
LVDGKDAVTSVDGQPVGDVPSGRPSNRMRFKPRQTGAFRLSFLAWMRSMQASTTSTGDSSRRRIRLASSVAVA